MLYLIWILALCVSLGYTSFPWAGDLAIFLAISQVLGKSVLLVYRLCKVDGIPTWVLAGAYMLLIGLGCLTFWMAGKFHRYCEGLLCLAI